MAFIWIPTIDAPFYTDHCRRRIFVRREQIEADRKYAVWTVGIVTTLKNDNFVIVIFSCFLEGPGQYISLNCVFYIRSGYPRFIGLNFTSIVCTGKSRENKNARKEKSNTQESAYIVSQGWSGNREHAWIVLQSNEWIQSPKYRLNAEKFAIDSCLFRSLRDNMDEDDISKVPG